MAREIPKDVKERTDRGRRRMEQEASLRNVCIEFVRGNQYLYSARGQVFDQRNLGVSGESAGKNRNRVRQARNFIKPIVDEKVSAASQQTPGYDIITTTPDHEAYSAASLARKVALAGYDKWNVRRARKDAIWYALVADMGFLYPYWDGSVGPYVDDGDGNPVALGEIRIRSFGGNEAYWEPGARFEDSRWHAIENARPLNELEHEEGFLPKAGKLRPDAATGQGNQGNTSKANAGSNLVMVTEYFERPCAKYPMGRHLTFANEEQIFEEQPFPLVDKDGAPIDEPPFLRLAYTADPDSDRDEGIVRHLLDAQRAANHMENKVAEWVNLALVPQILAPAGSVIKPPTDTPGEVVEFNMIPGTPAPEWRPVPTIPSELFSLKDRAVQDMRTIAQAQDLPASSITSGNEANALLEHQAIAWASFLGDLATLDGELMRRCLTLVQRHYSEPRIMEYKGRMGFEQVPEFVGTDLMGQTNVRVNVASIEPRTRRSMEQKVMNLAQTFPGYFPPEVLMAALNGGNAEDLINTYELDVERITTVIQKIRAGTLLEEPMRPVFPNEEFPDPDNPVYETDELGQPILDEMGNPIQAVDPMTGEPMFNPLTEVPGWMPRPFDGLPIQKATLTDWMKSQDYDELEEDQKAMAHEYYAALLDLESREAERNAQMQQAEAQEMGMRNATRAPAAPQGGSLPALPS